MSLANSTAELPTICKKLDLANAQVRNPLVESKLQVGLPRDNQAHVRQTGCDADRSLVSNTAAAARRHTLFTAPMAGWRGYA